MDTYDLYRLYKTLHVIAVVVLGGGFVLEAMPGRSWRVPGPSVKCAPTPA